MAKPINASDDTIAIANLIKRFEELETEIELYEEEQDLNNIALLYPGIDDVKQEFKDLEKLLNELAQDGGDEEWRGDWYPGMLINDAYFTQAMKELVYDIGDIANDFPKYLVIDWELTAYNLRADYSSVEINGTTFWYRCD